jgi:hypothetical protein
LEVFVGFLGDLEAERTTRSEEEDGEGAEKSKEAEE